jgi:AcrR family transcriptional regulator
MFKICENKNQSDKILAAAIDCISRKGYANVSLRDIANEAGVVLSQLNYYYKNKEGLFTQIVKALSEMYIEEIEFSLKKGKSRKERIAFLIIFFQNMLRKEPELFKLLFDLSSMALWSNNLKDLLESLFNRLATLIEKYILKDSVNKENLDKSSLTLSRMILGTLFGTSVQVVLTKDNDEIIASLSNMKSLFD